MNKSKIVRESLSDHLKGPSKEEVANKMLSKFAPFPAYELMKYKGYKDVAEIIKKELIKGKDILSQLTKKLFDKNYNHDGAGFFISRKNAQNIFKIICQNNFESEEPKHQFSNYDYQEYQEYISDAIIDVSSTINKNFLKIIFINENTGNYWRIKWLNDYIPSIKIENLGRDIYFLYIKNTNIRGEMSPYDKEKIRVSIERESGTPDYGLGHLTFPQFVEFTKYIISNPINNKKEIGNIFNKIKEKDFQYIPKRYTNDKGRIIFKYSEELAQKILEYFKSK